MIQLVVVDLYTKYEVSILNGCGDIFDEKVLRNYGRTDGRTDGTTDRCKPVYPPLFQSGGIIKALFDARNFFSVLFGGISPFLSLVGPLRNGLKDHIRLLYSFIIPARIQRAV